MHTVLGAFVAGILIGESPILTRHIDEQLRGLITAFFAPVFFGIAGLSADLTILADPTIALLTVGLIVIASIGKFGGAFIGAELGGLTRREGFALACGMNARGSTEVIIATVGLSMGALNQNLFTMIVAMAVITTMAMPPTLRWALSRIPMRKEEKQRLEREELEAKGFVANLERLLIAVDDSPNGKFASRVAGMLAGTHGMPTTVLHIPDASKIEDKKPDDSEKNGITPESKSAKAAEKKAEQTKSEEAKDDDGKSSAKQEKADKKKEKADDEKKAENAGETVKEAAEQIKSKQKDRREGRRAGRGDHHRARSAKRGSDRRRKPKKGYDLMIIGLEKTSHRGKEFHEGVTRLAHRLRRPAGDHGGARRPGEKARRQAEHPGAGERHRAVAPRGGSRHHHGARDQGAAHGALCRRPQRRKIRRAPRPSHARPRGSDPEGHRRDRRRLQHEHPHRGAGRQRRRRSHPQRSRSAARTI